MTSMGKSYSPLACPRIQSKAFRTRSVSGALAWNCSPYAVGNRRHRFHRKKGEARGGYSGVSRLISLMTPSASAALLDALG